MKKVLLSVTAMMTITIFAAAQSTESRNTDEADMNLGAFLPNWIDIDIDPETTNFSQNLNTNGSDWTTLEQGWIFGTVNISVSSTRKAQVQISATDLTTTMGVGPGYVIPATRLSADLTGFAGGVNSYLWSIVPSFDNHSGNNLTTSPQQIASSTAGCHNIFFIAQLAAYKCNTCTNTTYYSDNLVGSLTVPYTGSVDFLASLVNP